MAGSSGSWMIASASLVVLLLRFADRLLERIKT
jgi:hypothetical protein